MKQDKVPENIYETAQKRCKDLERLVEILKLTVGRRVYDEVIDNAVSAVELELMLLSRAVMKITMEKTQ